MVLGDHGAPGEAGKEGPPGAAGQMGKPGPAGSSGLFIMVLTTEKV